MENDLKELLQTLESVKQLKTIQDSQHRIIELLSARSLEQEFIAL